MADTSKKPKTCFGILILVASIELCTLPAIVIVWRHDRDELLAPKEQTLCCRVDRLVSAEEQNNCPDGFQTTVRKDTTDCCGTSISILDKLVTKLMDDKYDSDANPELFAANLTDFNCDVAKERKPVARLVGISKQRKPVLVGTSSKLFWKITIPSYLTKELQYLPDDGTIYIRSAGFYFVMLQIKLTLVITNTTDDVKEDTFRHYVHLISNNGTYSTILEDAKLQCDLVSAVAEYTSNVGAVFRLDYGDRLYVATSHPHFLETDNRNTYLSMHKV